MRRVRGIVFIFCALSIGAAGLPQTTGPMLTVPTIRIDVIAPTAVRLTADTPPGQRVYQIAVRKRREGTESALTAMPLSGESYKGTHWTGLDTVEPASTYRYQVMAESGTTRPSNSL